MYGLKEFNRISSNIIIWINSQIKWATEDKNETKRLRWEKALKCFKSFKKEYKANKYYDNNSWDFQFKVAHDVIEALKPDMDNYPSAMAISTFWTQTKYYLDEDSERFTLYDARQYTHSFTKKNKKLCKLKEDLEKLNTHPYTEFYYRCVKYRGIVGILDNFGDANIIVDGEIRQFPIEWDWWFNFDHYLDLEVGWNKE